MGRNEENSNDYIYAALHLASGVQTSTETAIIGLFLHHICVEKRSSPLNEKENKTVECFKTTNARTQLLLNLAQGKDIQEIVQSYIGLKESEL